MLLPQGMSSLLNICVTIWQPCLLLKAADTDREQTLDQDIGQQNLGLLNQTMFTEAKY